MCKVSANPIELNTWLHWYCNKGATQEITHLNTLQRVLDAFQIAQVLSFGLRQTRCWQCRKTGGKNYPSYDTVWGVENSDDTQIRLTRSRITRRETKLAALMFDLRRAKRTNEEAVCKNGRQTVLGTLLGRYVSIVSPTLSIASKERTKLFTSLPSTNQSSQTHSLILFVLFV